MTVQGKVTKRIAQSHSVQPEFALNEAELLRGDQPPMGDANPIERPIKIGGPEIQEIDEFRKVRREVGCGEFPETNPRIVRGHSREQNSPAKTAD